MKCIEAIEGTLKSIISKFHQVFLEDGLDDTEYVRNIKVVIDGTDMFLQGNKEILNEPHMLKQVLYSFSKELWLKGLKNIRSQESALNDETSGCENDGYDEYYYDYIYNHGVYPR
jgi:hypothetical protein